MVRAALAIVHAGWMAWRRLVLLECESNARLFEACQAVDVALEKLDRILVQEVL